MLWERAVCISLGERPLPELPFDYEVFRGCDLRGKDALHFYDPLRRKNFGRADLNAAEIGCAVSHREVARSVVESGKSTLVLEDDALLVSGIPSTAPNFSLAYLGYLPAYRHTIKSLMKLPYYWLRGRKHVYARHLNKDWYHAGWFNGAFAYVLTSACAEFIVRINDPVWMESDTALAMYTREWGAIALKRPAFSVRQDLPSSIGERESWK